MKLQNLLIAACFFTAVTFADVTKGGFGADRPDSPQSEEKSGPKSKRKTYPFHGTLDSVDPAAKTITLRGAKKKRVIIFTSDTRIRRNEENARIQDGTPGERVTGSVHKDPAGKEVAVSIRFAGHTTSK